MIHLVMSVSLESPHSESRVISLTHSLSLYTKQAEACAIQSASLFITL